MLKGIFHDTRIVPQVLTPDADDEELTGLGVDMQGYEGVAFVLIAGQGEVETWTIHAEQDDDPAFGDAEELAGTETDVATAVATDAVGILDIYQPQKRYVRPIVTVPDIAAVPAGVIAIKYHPRVMPRTNNVGEYHQSPDEGTP
jgi:hypothetical protein